MYIHIDADSMLYKAAGVAQQTVYTAADGTQYTALADLVAAGVDDYTKAVHLKTEEGDPLELALSVLRAYLRSIRSNVEQLWPDRQCIYKTYLSSSTNFRLSICPLYKANRTQPKPILLAQVKQWFVNKYAPVVIDNYEADDACSSAHVQCQKIGMQSVLVHIDKDMDTVVGTHYNPDKRLHYTITPEQALLNYYRQVLMGDSSDNVIGIKGVGPAKTAQILPTELLSHKNLLKELDGIVKAYYIKAGREGDFRKNKRLLKMVTNLNFEF